MIDAHAVGKRLREMRGMESQEQLANRLKISKSALSMYERGERSPRDEIKLCISNHFGISVQELFFDV